MEIHLKGGFSERKGLKNFSDIIQKEDLNIRTRNQIYSLIIETLNYIESRNYKGKEYKEEIVNGIYVDLFSCAIDEVPIMYHALSTIKSVICKQTYSDVYTFIEGFIKILDDLGKRTTDTIFYTKNLFIKNMNNIFLEENVDYRIVGEIITDVTTNEQIKSINETINNKYDVVSKHYQNALRLLYDGKDYSNSVKESISSVEAMCQIIDGSKKTLGAIIKKLNIEIHPALENAYTILYGYTSDENGTRHANGIGEKNATFEEVRYMLVSCSAFVNYLNDLYEKNIK